MLPPVEESVLQSNPEFAALYNTLTSAILNPDGTTKDDQSRPARERDAVRNVWCISTLLGAPFDGADADVLDHRNLMPIV